MAHPNSNTDSKPALGLAQQAERIAAAAGEGDLDAVSRLSSGCPPEALHGALCAAASQGRLECAKLLMEKSNPAENMSEPLRLAARFGHVDCALLLAPQSDPMASGAEAIVLSAREGRHECVSALIPFYEKEKSALALALSASAEACQLACAAALLPFCGPAEATYGLRCAILHGDVECAKLFLPKADLALVGEGGMDPLRLARILGRVDIAQMIASQREYHMLLNALSAPPTMGRLAHSTGRARI